MPAEGFDAYAILFDSSPKSTYTMNFNGGYVNPAWAVDYETAQLLLSYSDSNENVLTAGVLSSLGHPKASRVAYFLRYDLTFMGQSFDAKLTHIDYHYMGAGKNTLSFDYNTAGKFGSACQVYLTLGFFYRYSLNKWDNAPYDPLNFSTDDREWFFQGVLGTKLNFSNDQYLTLDMNNRDAFYSHNGDFIAFDLSYNVLTGESTTWRLSASNRFSGLLVGTGDISEQTVQFGFISQF